MAEFTDREHYIPLRKSDLVKLLVKDNKLNDQDRDAFRQFCTLVGAVWHFEYLRNLDQLKDAYAPFDPDAVANPLQPLAPEARPQAIDRLFDSFMVLMEKANFKRLNRQDIQAAVEGGASDWGINMHVNWDVFERLELFVRGDAKITRTKQAMFYFWREETKVVEAYQRLVLVVKLKKSKHLPATVDVNDVYLKMFKEIPKVDLEMVLPGTTLQMPWSQKSKLGVSLLGTLGYGLWSVGGKLFAAVLALFTAARTLTISAIEFALFAPFAVLFGYGYKQYHGYQITKQRYAKMLAESLYYQNLDNNAGVITQVLDEAEEQECRETILAYFYLWKYAPPQGWNIKQLDDYVEMDLEGKLGLKVDFEIEDAIAKLEKLGIVQKKGENYTAVSIDKALEAMDYRWDNYFQYNKSAAEALV